MHVHSVNKSHLRGQRLVLPAQDNEPAIHSRHLPDGSAAVWAYLPKDREDGVKNELIKDGFLSFGDGVMILLPKRYTSSCILSAADKLSGAIAFALTTA